MSGALAVSGRGEAVGILLRRGQELPSRREQPAAHTAPSQALPAPSALQPAVAPAPEAGEGLNAAALSV